MWAVEVRAGHLESRCVVVHLLQKILDEIGMVIELVAADALDVLVTVPFAVKDQLPEILGECESRIIA